VDVAERNVVRRRGEDLRGHGILEYGVRFAFAAAQLRADHGRVRDDDVHAGIVEGIAERRRNALKALRIRLHVRRRILRH
jgi:hypothetical protein